MPPPARKPDAILAPKLYRSPNSPRSGGDRGVEAGLRDEFRDQINPSSAWPRLGIRPSDPANPAKVRFWVREDGTFRFCSLDEIAHPRDTGKRPYYRWENRGDGVFFGYLLDPSVPPHPFEHAAPEPPSAPEPSTFDLE